MLKRVFDIGGASLGLILLSPLLAVVYCLIRLQMGTPVFFRQVRPGYHGKPFKILKFRTMLEAEDSKGQPLSDASRLTGLGRFLRATSLDELPELWNVLMGEMSLVGPRPLLMQYLPLYSERQMRRHEVRPGITGWAQINGRNAVDWPERFELDIWYVENQSFWLDLKILVRTVWKTVKRDGISAPGHATMDFFRGNDESSKV